MLTNNKKSFFVKGIALLMAMLMVLSVCLTGCGKAAEEAAKNAQDTADKAVTDAAAAQSAADAVKESLKDYLKTANAVTTQNVDDAIKAALEGYATTEELVAFVKSEDFDKLAAQLNEYLKADALDAAIKAALADYATGAELDKIQKELADSISKNQAAIKSAVDSLAGYVTASKLDEVQKALADKIAKGDAAATEALKGYVKSDELKAIQDALNGKIAATDKAVADAVASLEGYVKADEYALLVSSVQEMTFKLQTIDREHYGMVMETLAPYVENQEALAASVQFLMDELSNIDKKHHDHVVELLAGYTTTETFDLLASSVQALEADLFELHMNVKEQIGNVEYDLDLLTAAVAALDEEMWNLHMNVKEQIGNLEYDLDLLTARVAAIDELTQEIKANVKEELANHAIRLADLEGRMDRLEDVVRAILGAFYTEEEVKTFVEEEKDILDSTPELIALQFQKKMNTVDGSMSLSDWNATTTTILVKTIDNIQKLLEKLYADADGLIHNTDHMDAYLQINKKNINDALHVGIDEDKDGKHDIVFMAVDAFNLTTGELNDSYVVRKGLEYAVLRSGSAAQLKLLSEAIAKALDVNNFAEDLEELYATYLHTIGFADDTHHKDVQIVTFEHKDEINLFTDKFDDLIILYLYDTNGSAFNKTKYEELIGGGFYNFGKQPTMGVYRNSVNNKLYTYPVSKGASFKSGTITYTRVDYTIIFDGEGREWKVKDWCGLYYLPTNMNQFRWNGAAIKSVNVPGHHGSQINNPALDIWVANGTGNAGIYNALIEQSYDCQNLINTANAKFTQFLDQVVRTYGISKSVADFATEGVTMDSYAESNFNDSVMAIYQNIKLADFANIDKVSDMQFLYALTVAMCTPVAENAVSYNIYLTGNKSVQYYMTRALARNTCVDEDHKDRNYTKALKDQFYRYDLYEKMIDKAWYITFELYRTYAYEMNLDILADYISVLDYAIAHKSGVNANLTSFDDVAAFLTPGAYDITDADRLTDGFLEAFLNGGKFNERTIDEDGDGQPDKDPNTGKVIYLYGWTSNDVETQAAITIDKDFTGISLNTYYGALNNQAVGPDGNKIKADPIATMNTPYKAQTYAFYIRQYLQGASVHPSLEIMRADRDAAKRDHYDDIAYVFEEILKKSVDCFDEVYFRYLLEDYQKVLLNKAWADATETATFYCLDTDKAPLIKSMQNYLTSCDAAGNKVVVGANNFLFQNLVMEEKGKPTGQLPNGSMYQDIFAIDVDIFQSPVIDGYYLDVDNEDQYKASATNKRDLLVQILGEYMVDLDNMAIKYNFMSYLDDATQNLTRAQLNYARPFRNGVAVDASHGLQEMINELVFDHNSHNSAISILKFMEELGQIAFPSYFDSYTFVLNLIASNKQLDAEHVEVHLGRTLDTYVFNESNAGAFDIKVGILSSLTKTPVKNEKGEWISPDKWDKNILWVNNDLNYVVLPDDVLNTGAIYVGEAVRQYDEDVNANTKYHKDGVITGAYINLYTNIED